MWWILPFNECSQHQSQFTNPNTFQRLNATVAGTEKCFQYINCVNNSFNYIDQFLYNLHFLSDCNLVLTFSLDYDLFKIQIFCNLHPGSVIPDTWQDLVREEMMPPLHCTVLFALYTIITASGVCFIWTYWWEMKSNICIKSKSSYLF